MAINPAANGPLLKLILHLQKIVRDAKRNALLVIPLDIVNSLLQSSLAADAASVATLVNLFDGYNKGNCSRLDAVSFHCILHVLLVARPCPARGRGLYLFLESLRELTGAIQKTQDPSVLAAFHKRKWVLAQKTLRGLFQTFSSDDVTLPRRWSGEFIFELVRDSADNKLLLSNSMTDSLRQLGRTILTPKDPCLAFVAGATIREMLDAGYGASLLWPTDASRPVVARFPSTKLTDSEWLMSFTGFLRCLHAQQHPGSPETIKLIRSMEIQGQTPTPPPAPPACVVLLDPITFVSVRDQRLHFVDVPVRSISTVKALRNSIHLQLRHDGYYVANGLSRWSNQVSIGFNDGTQVADVGGIIEDKINWPVQNRQKHVTFASDAYSAHTTPKSAEKKSCEISQGPSAILALAKGEKAVGFDSVDIGPQKSIARARRTPSYATLELPSEDQVARESAKFRQRNEPSRTEVQDSQPTDAVTQVRSTQSPAPRAELPETVAVEQSEPAVVGSVLGEQSHCVPETVSDSSNLLISQGGQDSGDLQVVQSSSAGCDGDDYKDVDGGLPLLAQQALQLHVSHVSRNPPSSATETPGHKASGSDKKQPSRPNLTSQKSNIVEATMEVVSSKASNSSGAASSHHQTQAKDTLEPEINQTVATGQQKEHNRPPLAPAKSSRLKRPNLKARRAKTRNRSIDWYQDLRVEENNEKRSATKKAKCTPANPASENVVKPKKTKSSSPVKSLPVKPLPLTQSKTEEANNSPQKRRAKRQVTRTLASARSSRRAAVKANEKLADTHASEDIAYDPDDPIESSSPVMPDAEATTEMDADVVPPAGSDSHKDQASALTGDVPAEVSTADPKPSTEIAAVSGELALRPKNGAHGLDLAAHEQHNNPTDNTADIAEDKRRACDDGKARPNESSADHERSIGEKEFRLQQTASVATKNQRPSFVSTYTVPHRTKFRDPKIKGNLNTAACGPKPQGSSDLSRRVSQFISRQQACNAQGKETAEIEENDNGNGPSTALSGNRDITTSHPKAVDDESQVEMINQKTVTADERRGNADQQGSGLMPQENKEKDTDFVSFTREQKADGAIPEDERSEKKASHMISGNTNMGDCSSPVGYIASESSIDNDPISEASTLIPEAEADTMPAKREESSSPRELTKEQFLSCNLRDAYPSSRASSVEDDSPCPKGREPREPREPAAAGLKTMLDEKNRPGNPKTPAANAENLSLPEPRDVRRRKRCLAGSDDEEDITPGDNKQRADEDMHEDSAVWTAQGRRPTKRSEASPPSKNLKAADDGGAKAATTGQARSTFVDRLKAGANRSRKQGRSKSRADARQAPRASTVVTPESDHDEHQEQPSDPISKADTETHVGTQSTHYSSDYVSQESTRSAVDESGTTENEWQKALRDSQRNALDILLDTSHRLVRNMVDEEKAISSVVDAYKHGCSRIVDQMTQAHDENLTYVEAKQQGLQTELTGRCKTALEGLEHHVDDGGGGANPKTAAETKKLVLEADKRSRKVLRQIENVMQECQIEEGVQGEN